MKLRSGETLHAIGYGHKRFATYRPVSWTALPNHVTGAARPHDGKFVSLLVTTGNSQPFQIFLDHLNQQIDPDISTKGWRGRRTNSTIVSPMSWSAIKRIRYKSNKPAQ